MAENRPAVSQLMLSVNVENELATAFYRSCGFRLTGATSDGRIGPEQIMVGDISNIVA